MSGDGPGRYPRALELSPEAQTARFVFKAPLRPKRVSVIAYREEPDAGTPSEDLETVLSSRRNAAGEIVAWRASFEITPPPGYYLDLFAKWPTDECGPPRQLYHRFHVEPSDTR